MNAMDDPEIAPPKALLASRRHTTTLLLILAAVSLAAAIQARRPAIGSGAPSSQLAMYAVLIGVQWFWVRYVQIGMKAKGRAISEFFDAGMLRPFPLLQDMAYAIATLFAFEIVALSANYLLGGTHARNGFLLPHGIAESMVWVFLSLTAGFCEEVVFRGYLQRQLATILGSVSGGLALQAIIFGISHGYQGWRVTVIATAYGVVFGLLVWWRGNVRAGAIAHAATDIIAGLRLF